MRNELWLQTVNNLGSFDALRHWNAGWWSRAGFLNSCLPCAGGSQDGSCLWLTFICLHELCFFFPVHRNLHCIPVPNRAMVSELAFFLLLLFSFIEVQVTNKNYICLQCTAWCLDIHTHCEMNLWGGLQGMLRVSTLPGSGVASASCSHSWCPLS